MDEKELKCYCIIEDEKNKAYNLNSEEIKVWKEKYKGDFSKSYLDFDETPLDVRRHYFDPDGSYIKGNRHEFFEDLEVFLNKSKDKFGQENKLNCKYEYNFEDEVGMGIKVSGEDGNSISEFYLRSDQLGFSAPTNKKQHPYDLYIIKSDNKEEAVNQVCEWVANTRTIGSSFLWPIAKYGTQYKSWYNTCRGIRSYIEDRVDLTLWEIQCFYEIYEKMTEDEKKSKDAYDSFKRKYCEKYEDNILFLHSKINEDENRKMYKFLSNFSTFENYVDFFCFNGKFVQNGKIVDIVNSDVENGNYDYLDDNKVNKIKKNGKEICKIKKQEDLRRVLNNVRLLVLRRSEDMEKVINLESMK